METNTGTPVPHSAMRVSFIKQSDLYSAYMPFVRNGGLFIHTNKSCSLGDNILLLLRFFEETDDHSVKGKVIWRTPIGAQSSMPAGIGIQFNDASQEVRQKIETYLVGLGADTCTDTM